MDKRYQVFVSSTFADLKDERSNVIQTLMEMDCIPAGMELFPALDEEQFEFIKKVIDDSDYYLLIIGGRYGSISDQGFSYTEMEYDYAISQGVKVIALVHGSPEKLSVEKVEMNPEAQDKLEKFRNKVTTGRLVKFWSDARELPGLVALSLPKTIKTYPAVGWVRGNEATDNTELLKQLNDLRQENSKLNRTVKELQSKKSKKLDLAQGDDEVPILVKCRVVEGGQEKLKSWKQKVTWNDLIKCIGPRILKRERENIIFDVLSNYVASKKYEEFSSSQIEFTDFEKIKIQFLTLDYVDFTGVGSTNYWEVTPEGQRFLLEIMSIRREINEENDE
jgi:predicted transcriptional regulator